MRTLVITLFLFLSATPARTEVEVAFLIRKKPDGRTLQFHPKGYGFYHVAVSYKGKWLHAHPDGGVQLTKDLASFGQVAAVLKHPKKKEPSRHFVSKVLGKSYDPLFQWNNSHSFYCSKLLAQHFRLNPTLMQFEGDQWAAYFLRFGFPQPPRDVGISPDEVYDLLVERGFRPR